MLDQDKNEQTIFQTAVRLINPAEREAFVKQTCGDDPALVARLTSLLKAHGAEHVLLDALLPEHEVDIDGSAVSEGPGTVIGRYKLLEKIGEGGMAVVYMAEQTEPIRRKVALKIIKLGMDTRQVIARFEAERQALALMDHPSIAKVLDAGATETGRPYFVMELVTGVSITEYCDKNSLSTKDRLALFLQVCHAVQHAHQKGIIHRDIKPSNVMVTHHDGKPVPKVIDFGIAKATNQRLTEKTLFTRYAHLIGTPAYMSPEQAELSDLDIDTRTDIYSLGVLLYELLTGTTPFSEEELRKAGYVEMQRVIREQEPVKPSTRIRTARRSTGILPVSSMGVPPMNHRQDADATKNHGQDARGTHGRDGRATEVRGDLDWIVMKSLEKDRSKRYETVNTLAMDVQRHLDSEPVLARAPSAAYRLQKFLRRNRARVVTALVMSALATAGIVALALWSSARQQANQVEAARDETVLFQARQQHAEGNSEAALETVRSILDSRYFGPEAKLLYATILVERRKSDEARALLDDLLDQPPAIAGAAHVLMVRLLREGRSLDAETFERIQEHQHRAEALLAESAEAYFMQAMGAMTIKEQLALLNNALELDPEHYASLRLRAFTYYASRKYGLMLEDALDMTNLRRRDPLGHSLRAVALRELGNYGQAIAAYDRALKLVDKSDSRYVDLSLQRCETSLRMGDYERVIAVAQEGLRSFPDTPAFQYYIFSALTALGEYAKADALFRKIVERTPTSRSEFRDWCDKYVFDTLEAGRSWHPADREPAGAAFLPMVEAEENYRKLSAKARCVIKDCFSGRWSPDGRKLAFSMGARGYSGVALYDTAMKETELLIIPGKDPQWSPDGQFIAFVRDCQVLPVEEFATATAEQPNLDRATADEEVWIMNSDGSEPRRLAAGGYPSWGQDSTYVYYQSRVDRTFNSISIVDRDAEPRQITACSYGFPSVSPDSRRVAYLEDGFLRVKDLDSQRLVAQWRQRSAMAMPGWSPKGDELCVGMYGGVRNTSGLWIYRFDRREPVKVLGGPMRIRGSTWSPDRSKLVFHLGPPYCQFWSADLDPNVSTIEALTPTQMLEEHWRDMVRLCTRRIETDPLDAVAYSDRAQCYDRLHERVKADADMKRWSAVVSGRSPSDSLFGTSRGLRWGLDLPFDCELVFSAERPVNTIPTMSVAFGQKGRCEMKLFEVPMVVTSLVGLCFLTGLDAPPARADFTFGQPTDLDVARQFFPTSNVFVTCFSSDYREMFVYSDLGGGQGGFDIWVLKRASPADDWGPPENLGPIVNSPSFEASASISGDGLDLYLVSNRPGGHGAIDLYVTRRATRTSPWGQPTTLGSKLNSSYNEFGVSVSSDGLELYFDSGRAGGLGASDIYVSTRATTQDLWGDAVNLGPQVNSPFYDQVPRLSPDGLLLLFQGNRPGGFSAGDLWMTRRASRTAPWESPVNLGPVIDSPENDCQASIAPDGSALYFAWDWSDRRNIPWKAPIIPVVDFNGDGKVDSTDMAVLVDNWGKSDSVCDIGPFAWGDGIVDEKDLRVLMELLMNPGPRATDVPSDVVMSWIGPPFADSYDVYFGTSFDDVNNATRDDPCGVLASEQTETTYDPEGLLEFGQTYCWRVDTVQVVLGSLDPVIYKGSVLSFTTEAYARPIKNIIATASSAQPSMGPEKTVDGSGLDTSDGHSTTGADMWLSAVAGPQPVWIQYQFDKVYALHELWVWNSNSAVEPFIGFGAKTVKIEYSPDGTTWTPLANVPEFAKAPGKPGYTAETKISFGGVSAKYVKLTIEKGWGTTGSVGLSEVRFFYIPDRSATKP